MGIDGQATAAQLNAPRDVFDLGNPGDTYIADTGNNRIRKVDGAGIITTVAGNGTAGYHEDGALRRTAAEELNSPSGVAVDSAGNIYIADTGNNRIRKVKAATGIITTIAGAGSGGVQRRHDGASDLCQAERPTRRLPVGLDVCRNDRSAHRRHRQ